MRNFKIEDGDLVLNSAKRADLVDGEAKLLQDLTLWLQEPIGTGFTTPSFGTTLHDMIGSGNIEDHALEVEAEVQRMLSLYQSTQIEQIKDANNNGRLALYSKREVLYDIVDVQTQVILDRILVTAKIRNGRGNAISLQALISPEGTQIAP